MDVNPFFAMDGLGLALKIEHGMGHHFLGAMFSHQTCVCVCMKKENDCLSISNSDNNFLIVGWGTSGGSREVNEAATVPRFSSNFARSKAV